MSNSRLFPHLREWNYAMPQKLKLEVCKLLASKMGWLNFLEAAPEGVKTRPILLVQNRHFFSETFNHNFFLINLKNRLNLTKYPNFWSLAPLDFFINCWNNLNGNFLSLIFNSEIFWPLFVTLKFLTNRVFRKKRNQKILI